MKHAKLLGLLSSVLVILIVGVTSAFASQTGDLCHVPPGNPENAQVISVGDPGYANHLENHEDDFIIDGNNPCPPVDEEDPEVTPVVTEEATDEPIVTEEPTDEPEATDEPTDEPVVTEEPTDEPVVTEEPVVCPEGTHLVEETCVPDEEEPEVTPEAPLPTAAPAIVALPQECTDVFHPFLAVQDFSPAAQGFLVENATWNGYQTDLSASWYVWLDIVPEIRDAVRLGNDAGILCGDDIPAGPQIIAFRVLVDGEWITAGLVLVHTVDDSILIDAATILRPDILTRDPLWGGAWE